MFPPTSKSPPIFVLPGFVSVPFEVKSFVTVTSFSTSVSPEIRISSFTSRLPPIFTSPSLINFLSTVVSPSTSNLSLSEILMFPPTSKLPPIFVLPGSVSVPFEVKSFVTVTFLSTSILPEFVILLLTSRLPPIVVSPSFEKLPFVIFTSPSTSNSLSFPVLVIPF